MESLLCEFRTPWLEGVFSCPLESYGGRDKMERE